jgi:N-dimethylarginine dimethylaminohydrolase
MAAPSHFTVESDLNPWMADEQGNLNRVDAEAAQTQWLSLAQAYRGAGLTVEVLDGVPGLPDFCFAANQSLAFLDDQGRPTVILSRMASDTRAGEVEHFRRWYQQHGFVLKELPANLRPFEGTGDAIRHHGRHFFWGGVGPRTRADIWPEVAGLTGAAIAPLRLTDPRYYHLDTALCVVGERSALFIPDAFDAPSRELLEAGFQDLIPVCDHDAARFGCNAHCPDDNHVFIQRDCDDTAHALRQRGLTVVELDTGEFIKSGGSVFCLKQELP